MKTSHTPGPWLRMGHRQIAADLVIDRPIICEVYSGSVGNEDADANEALIAAAPELLALLAESEKIIMNMGAIQSGSAAHSFLFDVRRAVMKARGES